MQAPSWRTSSSGSFRLIVLVSAFDALGLPAVSQVLQQLLLWLPNLVVALVILVLAGLAATALASLVRGATAEASLGNPELLATVARVAVWGFAIVIAVNQIGIATTLVNTLFMGMVGALALALGLAFGLGGRTPRLRSGRAGISAARQRAQNLRMRRNPLSGVRRKRRVPRQIPPGGTALRPRRILQWPRAANTCKARGKLMATRFVDEVADGMDVFDAADDKIGTVDEVYDATAGEASRSGGGYLRVPTGFLGMGAERHIPFSAIRDVRDGKIYLNVAKDRLGDLGYDEVPMETDAAYDRDIVEPTTTSTSTAAADDGLPPRLELTTRSASFQLREEELIARKRTVETGASPVADGNGVRGEGPWRYRSLARRSPSSGHAVDRLSERPPDRRAETIDVRSTKSKCRSTSKRSSTRKSTSASARFRKRSTLPKPFAAKKRSSTKRATSRSGRREHTRPPVPRPSWDVSAGPRSVGHVPDAD